MNTYREKKEKLIKEYEKLSVAQDKLDSQEFALNRQWSALQEECPHEHTKAFMTDCFDKQYQHISCTDCNKLLSSTEVVTEVKSENLWIALRKKFWRRKN
jgi:hypothetical protein